MTPYYCHKCGHQLSPGSRFCDNCGSSLAPESAGGGCPNCSKQDVGDGEFCRWCQQLLTGSTGIKAAGLGRLVGAYILDIVLFFVTLILGYIIWWLFTLSRGQTPGKQLLGIRVIRADGTPSDWGWAFIREFIIKTIAFSILDSFLGIATIVDLLWAFWDKNRQTLHDKIMKTVVVDDRAHRQGAIAKTVITL